MRHNPKNILHVVNVYFVLPYYIGPQFDHFTNKGYRLHVACSPSPYLQEYSQARGFDYLETNVNRRISIMDDLKSILKVRKYIIRNHIGIVEGHTPKGALIGIAAAWLARVPKRIYFRHGLVYETSTGLKRQLLKTIDRLTSAMSTQVVCVSRSVMKRSIEDKLSTASKMCILLEGTCNGIDTAGKYNPTLIDQTKLEQYRSKYGIKETDTVIGYTGRLVRDKGIAQLVEAFDLLRAGRQGYKLLLVGMFEERDALSADIQRKIMDDPDIIYTGFINEDQEYHYALMTLYVLPSYREGFPTGVLEAESMGVPVLTTDATGCVDSIIPGVTGERIKIEAKDIAQKINYVLQPERHAKMGEEARKWVVQNFDRAPIWDEIEKLYT